MKSMKLACRRFEKANSGYECYLDEFDSCRGNYHIYIGNDVSGSWCWFGSVESFRQWAKYVLL